MAFVFIFIVNRIKKRIKLLFRFVICIYWSNRNENKKKKFDRRRVKCRRLTHQRGIKYVLILADTEQLPYQFVRCKCKDGVQMKQFNDKWSQMFINYFSFITFVQSNLLFSSSYLLPVSASHVQLFTAFEQREYDRAVQSVLCAQNMNLNIIINKIRSCAQCA